MGTIPDFNEDAYALRQIQCMDLTQLAHGWDHTHTVKTLIEARHRQARDRFVQLGRDSNAEYDRLKEEYNSSVRSLTLIKAIARDVRRVFAKRLRQHCGSAGYLVDRAVYRASVDEQGVERIELFNPPAGVTQR